MGLKDQQLALKWIHDNIAQFSGDNKRITLFGQSAGSVSTHFHVLSSESRKYFRNVICLSGSTDDFWAFNDNEDHWNVAKTIVKDFNAPQYSFIGIVEFIKSLPAEKINDYTDLMSFFGKTLKTVFGPVIESMLNYLA